MSKPSILYSASTVLAYRISVQYYDDVHYVWCSPRMGATYAKGSILANPPSASPIYRYRSFERAVAGGDLHSPFIAEHKVNLMKGADTKYNDKKITLIQRNDIFLTVQSADLIDFKPLMYIIVFDRVSHLVTPVPIAMRANPTSEEYIIPELPGHLMEIEVLEE